MASIPGAVFKTVKIHDEIARFRKRSASNVDDYKHFEDAKRKLETEEFRQRSASVNAPPGSDTSTPTSGLTPTISGDSLRNLVGGFMESFNVLRPKQIDSSLESCNEDFPAMLGVFYQHQVDFELRRNYPNAGSITDLVNMK